MRLAIVVGLSVLFLAGCFTPKYGCGDLVCGANGTCPPGFHCGADNRCYEPACDPDLSVPADLKMEGVDLSSSDDAAPTNTDMAGAVKHQGEPCGPSDTCDTGNCVDGYCCDSPCNGSCQACNLANNLGHCSNVDNGQKPVGARSCTMQPATSCGSDGTCDGAGNCRNWPSGTQCAPGVCNASTGKYSNKSTCDGAGNCVSNGGGDCAPYKCQDATQCYSSCTDNNQCSGTNSCVNQSCGPLSNGRACTGDAQCTSGYCVDGLCCDSRCGGSCQACDVGGHPGACTTVGAGNPHGMRSCTNQGAAPCGGTCNGMSASCSYAPNTTLCGSTCASDQLRQSFCDGNGSCVAAAPVACLGHFDCPAGASACTTKCTNNNDCYPSSGYGCSNTTKLCSNYCKFGSDNFDDGCIFTP